MTSFFTNKLVHVSMKMLGVFIIAASIFGPGTPMTRAQTSPYFTNDPIGGGNLTGGSSNSSNSTQAGNQTTLGEANNQPIQQITQQNSVSNLQQIGTTQVTTGAGDFSGAPTGASASNVSTFDGNQSSTGNVGITSTGVVGAQQSGVGNSVSTANQFMTPNKVPTDDIGCSNILKDDGGRGLAVCVSNLIYFPTVGLGGWAASITAYIFDFAVKLSLNSTAYALNFITLGWGVVRDLANMSFLFILVYIAFKIMFQAETAGTIRMLTWVVVMALLVNFSFFASRMTIDAGNILATQFYNAIQVPTVSQTAVANNGAVNSISNIFTPTQAGTQDVKDLTTSIMNALNVQSLTNVSTFQGWVKNPNNSPMYLLVTLSIIYIMIGLALFILAASFLFAGIKFVLRVVGLWGIIVVAPIAFVAAIFRGDKGGKWFNMWLAHLIKFSFYPAIFLFFFWVQTIFMQEMGTASMFNNIFNTTSNAASSVGVIASAAANVGVRLGFIVATLWVTLKAADYVVAEGNSAANFIQGKLLGGAIGATAFIGRNSLGASGRIWGSGALANRTYDLRNAPILKNLIGNSLGKPASQDRAWGLATRDTPEGKRKALEAKRKEDKERTKLQEKESERKEKAEQKKKEEEEKKKQQAAQQNTNQVPSKKPIPFGGARYTTIVGRGSAANLQRQSAQATTGTTPTTTPASATTPANGAGTQGAPHTVRAPGTTPAANAATPTTTAAQPMNIPVSAQHAIEALQTGAQREYREQNAARSEPVQKARNFIDTAQGDTEAKEHYLKLREQNEELKRVVKEQVKKVGETVRAGAFAGSLSTTSPDMSQSKAAQRSTEALHESVGRVEEQIQGLGAAVRQVVKATKEGTPMPERIVVSVNTTPNTTPQFHPTPPTSGAPAAPQPRSEPPSDEAVEIRRKAA